MREIKFRAWDKRFKKMFVPSQIDYELGGELADSKKENVHVWRKPFSNENANWSSSGQYIHGEDVELMQYTGLKDRNGKEIYEGDIIEYRFSYKSQIRRFTAYVDWCEELVGYCLRNMDGTWKSEVNGYEFINNSEVIGNIYENKELIEHEN